MPVTENEIDGVRRKLVRLAADDPKYLRVLFFIDEEEEKYQQCGSWPPVLKTFAAALDNETVFCQYAEKHAMKLERVELSGASEARVQESAVHCGMRSSMSEGHGRHVLTPPVAEHMGLNAEGRAFPEGFSAADGYCEENYETRLTRCGFGSSNYGQDNFGQGKPQDQGSQETNGYFSNYAVVILRAVVPALAELCDPRIVKLVFCPDEAASVLSKQFGDVMMGGLAAAYLSYQTLKTMRRWWRGEITGKRAGKNIVDAFSMTAGGVVGGIAAGAAVGAAGGPVCAAIGGMVGSFLGAWGSSKLSEFLTLKLFDIPKDEALDNAYSYFGVTMHTTNSEINTAFRKKCLQTHPDKGGSAEDFYITQFHMAVITLAREGPERSSLQNHLRSTQSIRY